MAELVKLMLNDGSWFLVEGDRSGGYVPAGGSDRVSEGGLMEEALQRVQKAAQQIVGTFREVNTPDEISVEMALKFSSKANGFFLGAGAETLFTVKLKWANAKENVGGKDVAGG